MFTKILSEKKSITPRQAERFLTLNTFEGQRKLNPDWVSQLSNYMRNDTFLTGHIAIALFSNGTDNPIPYLVNGQHQCNAVIVANKTIDILYEKYDCETIDDVGLLYQQFDNHKTRSLQNLVHFEKQVVLGLDWPDRIASLIVSAASLKKWGRGSRVSKTEKISLLKDNLPVGDFVNNLLTNTPGKKPSKETAHLRRSPVIHAILLTWEKGQKASHVFWTQVRDGEGLSLSMPAYKLREFLKESSYNVGAGSRIHLRRLVGAHEMTSRCITAWNSFRSGKSTGLKYYPNKPIPRAI